MCIYIQNEIRCSNVSIYGFNGKRTHCLKHKYPGMIDNLSKRCEYPNCLDFANYGYNRITHCKKHKNILMDCFDPVTCRERFCENIAEYGLKKSKTHCYLHKKEGMTKSNSKTCYCGKPNTYGYYGQLPITCEDHKTDNMINLTDVKNKKFKFSRILKTLIKI